MSRLPGIIEAKASYRDRNVVVQYDPAAVTPAEIADVIATETYYTVGKPAIGGELAGGSSEAAAGSAAIIHVEGMTDERTASLVTQAMGAVGPAILDVSPDTAQSTLTVTFDGSHVSVETLVDAINRGTELQASLISTASAGADARVDYTPYVVLGIAGLFVAALAWPAVSWSRRQLARATPARTDHRRVGRGRRGR